MYQPVKVSGSRRDGDGRSKTFWRRPKEIKEEILEERSLVIESEIRLLP